MSREYPATPVASVGVIVRRDDGAVLLVRRANPPSQGLWSVPGGRLELGETAAECARREVREECGVECVPTDVFHVVDRIYRNDEGRVQYHYVIVELLAWWSSGEPVAGDDASAVAWVHPTGLNAYDLTPGLEEVIVRMIARSDPV